MTKIKLLAVLVNYGEEQLDYLRQVVGSLKRFKKYDVTVMVNSNIPLTLAGIDTVNVFKLDNYQYLPLTCRRILWENREAYDVFIYGENDHLFLEHHIDRHLEYTKLLPKNRIAGLIQYEVLGDSRYYPGYHKTFDWDYSKVEQYGGKVFAHFSNVHQASFILTQEQLKRTGTKFNFEELVVVKPHNLVQKYWSKVLIKLGLLKPEFKGYSLKCKVNTDIYQFAGMKKVICISEFEDNLIHHLPNLYIHGDKGRQKMRSPEDRMRTAIAKLLKK